MDIVESISFESLPVFFQCVLWFCGVCLSLVLVGLCIIALIMTLTGIRAWVEDFLDDLKEGRDNE